MTPCTYCDIGADDLCRCLTPDDDGIRCPACRGSGRQITEDNYRACSRCGGDGAWRPASSKMKQGLAPK